ncbi:MAG: hypothetical protein AAF705_19730 [Bacteroidota bacterium]
MRTILIASLFLLLCHTNHAQSYELLYDNSQQMRLANWTSNLLPDMTVQYVKRDFLLEPKIIHIFHQTDLVYTFERKKGNHILRNQDNEVAILRRQFTYKMGNGERYTRKIKSWGKYIELYDQNEELIARATIFRVKDSKRKLEVKIIKSTDDDQALLSLMAVDLLEHFRMRNNAFL